MRCILPCLYQIHKDCGCVFTEISDVLWTLIKLIISSLTHSKRRWTYRINHRTSKLLSGNLHVDGVFEIKVDNLNSFQLSRELT